ncbi:hypothetical protein OA92_00570 [Marinomonas sp. SBI22]|uniref:four-carbon acid sugar kinase family protein n=1 Tax=unclassified Marinomonas TaxID=196814 RepID=UPI0007AF02E7|nr:MULTISPECIES: four-carbon acid sugar kinase family protein [unclassified Marinomonas]KZM45741.1 hypothetical protein OA92_00570 [Marinomonas sp. SBI22]KZM46260.1 hypothetical protein OA91_04715 [Marinomonas sp. SBI8L]
MKNLNATSANIAIIADDLTSAADGAAPFLAKGLSSLVLRQDFFELEATQQSEIKTQLIALDTGSRQVSEQAAIKRVQQAIHTFSSQQIIYKTIDSTLRGHIRAELEALYQSAEKDRFHNIVIAPAFPDAGRTTHNGIQFVQGKSVSTSQYANDPVHPARTSSIKDLIAPSLGQATIISTGASQEDITRAARQQLTLILDAKTQTELNQQVALIPNRHKVLWIGSPGLAQALANTLDKTARTYSHSNKEPLLQALPQVNAKKCLIVIGSANPVSQAQCKYLKSKGVPVVFSAKALFKHDNKDAQIACLTVPPSLKNDAKTALKNLTSEAQDAIHKQKFDALIATGGETMNAILSTLSIKSFQLIGEFEAGFPLAKAIDETGTPLALAMKAGGFGGPNVLYQAAHSLLTTHD